MKLNRKVIQRSLVCFGIIFAGLVVLSAVLPLILDLEKIRDKAAQAVSRELGGSTAIESIDTGLFPPRIIFKKTTLSVPGRMTGSIVEIALYPRILSLIGGRIELSGVSLQSPDLVINLSDFPQEKDRKQAESPLSAFQKALTQASSKAAGLSVDISQGRITFESEKHSVTFDRITSAASFNSDNVIMNLHCAAPFLEKASLSMKISPETFRGKGDLTVHRFMPQHLPKTFAPDLLGIIDEAEGDFHLHLSLADVETLRIEAAAAFPRIAFSKEKGSTSVNLQEMEVVYDLRGRAEEITLKRLTFSDPALSVSGRLFKKGDDGRIILELNGEEIDVVALRAAALTALPDVPVVQNIFGYLRSGKVPRIAFRTDGESLSTLGRTENISVQGSLSNGKIHIPGPDLLLHGVSGDVVIAQGILKGTNIVTHFKGIRGENGTVRVGLRGKDAPIHIETAFRISVSDVPGLLKNLTWNSEEKKELSTAGVVSDGAEGRVIIGERLNAIKISVKDAHLCGIKMYGTAGMPQKGMVLDIRFEAQDQELKPTILCLSRSRNEANGTFSLKADLQGKGGKETLGKNIRGAFDFTAKEGSISRLKSLDSVFDFLNKGEEVKGQLPDLDRAEFKYKLLRGRGTLSSGSLKFDEAVLESDAVHLVSRGKVDFEEGTLDLDVMVAVNKTADTVVRRTPLIGTIFGGSLVSVPVKVRGRIAEPQVIYLSPSAAVSNLTEMMKRTAGLPLEVLSPIFPKRKE